ncbi:MAG: RIP metalloprotease RseP [Candidatus Cloacimonetes bacterium]|nr:RIP metalloprotease RseP [Candidatus Cloacimonadota bacterium]
MLQILGALVALGLLVAVHEGGHFLAARWLGVYVEKFSIGFGPKLISFRDKMTEYRISLIPLGGYVKMKGENPDEEVTDPKGSFLALEWWKRAIIAFAGPFTNLLFAVLILIITFGMGKNYEDYSPIIGNVVSGEYAGLEYLQSGDKLLEINDQNIESWSDSYSAIRDGENDIRIDRAGQVYNFTAVFTKTAWVEQVLPETSTIIGEVSPGLPAYNAGLMEGDQVVSINGNAVNNWYELRNEVLASEGKSVTVEIIRDNGRFEREITLQENLLDGSQVLGITQKLPLTVHESYNLGQSITYGTLTAIDFTILNYVGIYKLLMKPSELKNNLGGPVLMYTMSKQTVKQGWNSILNFIAIISIILMVMNLLPIPILDGGMIFFCIIEGIRGKSLSLKTQMTLQKIGASILILLMFFAFSNDFSRIFKRSGSIRSQQTELDNQINGTDIIQ